jgi:hypothetical protein
LRITANRRMLLNRRVLHWLLQMIVHAASPISSWFWGCWDVRCSHELTAGLKHSLSLQARHHVLVSNTDLINNQCAIIRRTIGPNDSELTHHFRRISHPGPWVHSLESLDNGMLTVPRDATPTMAFERCNLYISNTCFKITINLLQPV